MEHEFIYFLEKRIINFISISENWPEVDVIFSSSHKIVRKLLPNAIVKQDFPTYNESVSEQITSEFVIKYSFKYRKYNFFHRSTISKKHPKLQNQTLPIA